MVRRSRWGATVAMLVTLVASVFAFGAAAAVLKNPNYPPSAFERMLKADNPRGISFTKNKYAVDLMHGLGNSTLFAGQELRVRIRTLFLEPEQSANATRFFLARNTRFPIRSNTSAFPAFNISGKVQLRVISAFTTRTSTVGLAASCGAAAPDVWYEARQLSGRALAWGRRYVFSAYTSFVVPPFKWRVCLKDTMAYNRTAGSASNARWESPAGDPGVQRFLEPKYLYRTATDMYAGDFAAIKVIVNGRGRDQTYNGNPYDPLDRFMSGSNLARGDSVKVVPAGFPCTYEKSTASAELVHNIHTVLSGTTAQYCGSNYVRATSGSWVNLACVAEGSVADGVARTGSVQQNPWATHSGGVSPGAPIPTGVSEVAYLRLPAAGTYDLCISPRSYRLALLNITITPSTKQYYNSVPVWFKMYNAATSTCPTVDQDAAVATCQPRTTAFTIAASSVAAHGMAFEDSGFFAGSWGHIRINGTGLSSRQATAWEYSSPREYFETAGGDQFRLVPESAFAAAPMTAFGGVYANSAGQRFTVADDAALAGKLRAEVAAGSDLSVPGSGGYTQRTLGTPQLGTSMSDAGCWTTADNFGGANAAGNGAPGSQCCNADNSGACISSACSMSDADQLGPISSGNLGSHPRDPYSPWARDGLSTVETYAYVRFLAGHWRVCYRKAGTQNWRVLSHAKTGAVTMRPLNFRGNYTYSINDTRAETLGYFTVTSPRNDLTTLTHNIYDTTVPDSAVVGAELKIVPNTESCQKSSPGSRFAFRSAGLAECTMTQCNGLASCANCAGAASSDSSLRRSVTFHVQIPVAYASSSSYYRVCFRNKLENWYELPNPNYAVHQYSTIPSRFHPHSRHRIFYTLDDRRASTWARLVFKREATGSPMLRPTATSVGDVVRLVPNATGSLQTTCGITWGVPNDAYAPYKLQVFDPSLSVANLGVSCAGGSGAAACAAAKVAPADADGVVGTYPYTTLDSTSDADYVPDTDGTVAFLQLPAPSVTTGRSYRVCYRQGRNNWIEAIPLNSFLPRYLSITTNPGYSFSLGHSALYSGMYTYIAITGTAAGPVRNSDLVKLVPSGIGCDRPAAGGATAANRYVSMVRNGVVRGGSRIVDGTSDAAAAAATQPSSATTMRFYLTLPSLNSTAAALDSYRVCYMSRTGGSDTTMNWQSLGTVAVTNLGLNFEVEGLPVQSGVNQIIVRSTSHFLNTSDNGDRLKVVPDLSPCTSDFVVPFGVTSFSSLLEHSFLTDPVARATGLVNLGPANAEQSFIATANVTMPSSGSTFRVCYKPLGLPWMTLELLPSGGNVYRLDTAIGLRVVYSGLHLFTVSAAAQANSPGGVYLNYGASGLPYPRHLIAGFSLYDGTTTHLTVSGVTAASNMQTGDRWKFVQVSREVAPGQYVALDNTNCASDGETGNVTAVSATSTYAVGSVPMTPGIYLFCYRLKSNTTWIQLENTNGDIGNPIRVIASSLWFAIDTSAKTVRIDDLFSAQGLSFGGLQSSDIVYITYAAGVCGVSNDVQSVVPSGVTTNLAVSSINGSYVARRTTNTISWVSTAFFVAAGGPFKVCVKRTQGTNTYTAGVAPFLRTGWYQAVNAEASTGLGSGLYTPIAPVAVAIDSCPPYNTTNTIRTGRAFSVTARIVDAAGNQIRSAINTYAYLVTAAGSFAMTNTEGQCRPELAPLYGWDASNLRQFAVDGAATFSIVPTGACPSGGCALSFASAGLTTSSTCTFGVANTIAATLKATAAVATCWPGEPCSIRVAAFHTDGDVAHTATDSISYAATLGGLGLSTRATATGATASGSSGGLGALTAGVVTFDATFVIAQASAVVGDATVTFIFTASNSGASTSIVVTVKRPTVVGVHIVDIYPSTQAEAPTRSDAFVDPRFVPSWEPAAPYMGGAFDEVVSSATVRAAPGYHLVAQQFYTVRLRLVTNVNGKDRYLSDFGLLDAASRVVTITLTGNAAGNEVLAYSSACLTDDGCSTPFSSVILSGVEATVTFRLKNGIGCQPGQALGGCNISFQFGGRTIGASAAAVITPVRSMATKLSVTCWAAPAYDPASPLVNRSLLPAGSPAGCPPSAVERGWLLDVTAVDEWGTVDSYFAGTVLPYLTVPATSTIRIATVAQLLNASAGTTAGQVSAVAANGVARFERLTLTQPCTSGCSLELFAQYGSGVTSVGALVAPPSTHHLECQVATPLVRCASAADGCGSVTGAFAYSKTSAASNLAAAIYSDTNVCFNVFAADSAGRPTRYDTVWVHYSVRSNASAPVTAGGSSGPRARYQPLFRGGATFCFQPNANGAATFEVEFIAQQFDAAGHWTRGATGRCTLGTFSVFERKVAGGLRVDGIVAQGATVIGAPAAEVGLRYTIAPTGVQEAVVSLSALDYYGNAIAPYQVHANDADVQIVIEHCTVTNLNSTCIQGTINAAQGAPNVNYKYAPGVVGAITVNVPSTPRSKISDGANAYSLRLLRYCLGCSFSFVLRRTGNVMLTSAVATTTTNGNTTAAALRATVNVNAIITPDVAASRYVGFKAGTSPYRLHWAKHTAPGSLNVPRTSAVALFNKTCLVPGSGCEPVEAQFMNSVCGSETGTQAVLDGSASGDPMQFVVNTGESGVTVTSNMELNCAFDNCEDPSRVRSMVDITTTYTVGVTIGTQLLHCRGTTAGCIGDNTIAPKQVVTAYGETATAAIDNFLASGGAVRSANFTLEGLAASGYYFSNNSYFNDTAAPTQSGALTVSATTTQAGFFVADMVDTRYLLVWRGGRVGKRLVFRDTSANAECPQTAKLKCFSGNTGLCPYTGYEQSLTLSEMAVNYTTGAFVGVPVPITVDVQSADGGRVYDATGTVALSLYSWSGCNNGGTVTIANGNGVVVNGRVTSTITFSAPCESCVFRAVLTPGSSGVVYAGMLASPASLIAFSQPITVQQRTPVGTHMMIQTPPADLKHTLTVADVTQVAVAAASNLGNQQLSAADRMTVAAYVRGSAVTAAFDQYWYGNGGFLRPSTAAPYATRHTATMTTTSGTGTLAFAFTRTCRLGCQITLYFEIPASASKGSVLLRNSHSTNKFFVFTALSSTAAFGFRPRMIQIESNFAVSQWHVGSELATVSSNPIPIAGVANGSWASPNIPSVQVVDATNGDAGRLTTVTTSLPSSEVHFMRLSRPCRTCTLAIGSDTRLRVAVVTTAVRIRVAPFTWVGRYATQLTNTFELSAVDALGFVDVRVGGNSDCSIWMPFTCAANSVVSPVAFALASEIPVGDTLRFTPFTQPSPGNGTMAAGRASIPVAFVSPVRFAEPVFTTTSGGVTLRSSTTDRVNVIVTGTAGEVVVKAPLTITAFLPVVVEVVMVKNIGGVPYVDTLAGNSLTLSFNDCPTLISSNVGANATLVRGAMNATLVFGNPTSTLVFCRVTANVNSASGSSCSTCSSSTSFSIDPSYGRKWRFEQPTTFDNRGNLAMPMFGAVGRVQTVVLQLLATGPDGDFGVGSCDDPTTGAIESCTISFAAGTGCVPAPTITGPTAFNSSGGAAFSVTYAAAPSGAVYTCPLQVGVTRGGSALAPTVAAFTAPVVEVCEPRRLKVVTNFTAATPVYYTGELYPITVAATDAYGRECVGDSQDVGTSVSFSVIAASGEGAPSIRIGVANTNLSTYTSAQTATATNGLLPANSARLVGGSFKFQVMFSNATESFDGRPVRLRFQSAYGTTYSNPIRTVYGASRLRIVPAFPRYAIANRKIADPQTGSSTYAVEAVDGVPAAWVAAGLLPGGPSVVRSSAHPGSSATFSWLLNPAGTFPFRLDGSAAPDAVLADGRRVYSSVEWAGSPTSVGVTVVPGDANLRLAPSTEQTITFQSASKLGLDRAAWQPASPVCEASPCTLPFTANAAGTAYNVNGGTFVQLRVFMLDGGGNVVVGEHESVIEAALNQSINTARMVSATAPTSTAPILARMSAGVAVFNLLLLGTTGNFSAVTIDFKCPDTRAASLLKPAELNVSTANPCRALAKLASYPVTIVDTRPPPSDFFSGPALSYLRVIRARSNATSLQRTRFAAFEGDLASRMRAFDMPYIDAGNSERVIVTTPCKVNALRFAATNDLGGSVCVADPLTGLPQCSAEQQTTSSCPSAVEECLCPAASTAARRLHVMLRRYLLQSGTNSSSGNNTNVSKVIETQIEVAFRLDRAGSFTGTTTADIQQALANMTVAAEAALRSSYFATVYGINPATVSSRLVTEALNTVAPLTAPPTNPPPPPPTSTLIPAPPTTDSATRAGGGSLLVTAALLLLCSLLLLLHGI